MKDDNKKTFDDYSEITSEGSIGAFQTSRVYHTEHHLPDQNFIQDQRPEDVIENKPRAIEEMTTTPEKEKNSPFKFRFYVLILFTVTLLGLFIGVGIELTRTYILNNTPEVQIKYTPELTQRTERSSSTGMSIVDIANLLEPSVVAITNEQVQDTYFGQSIGESTGSGVIFDISTKYLYILTNNHVIEHAHTLYISFFGDEIYPSQVIGADPDSDLAVITVDRDLIKEKELNRLKPVKLGDSDTIRVGETAIAIGSPLGYNNTVTVGVISALNRIISDDFYALSLIQTDAAINPGNSGGALVNAQGELVGINTIKISDTSVEGIGFAIPINTALPILNELVDKGYVSKPYIGIYGQDVTEATSRLYNIPLGVVINDFVRSGPAAQSKLKMYDIIIAIEDEPILSMRDLTREIASYEIGTDIKITVMREVNKSFVEKVITVEVKDKHGN